MTKVGHWSKWIILWNKGTVATVIKMKSNYYLETLFSRKKSAVENSQQTPSCWNTNSKTNTEILKVICQRHIPLLSFCLARIRQQIGPILPGCLIKQLETGSFLFMSRISFVWHYLSDMYNPEVLMVQHQSVGLLKKPVFMHLER